MCIKIMYQFIGFIGFDKAGIEKNYKHSCYLFQGVKSCILSWKVGIFHSLEIYWIVGSNLMEVNVLIGNEYSSFFSIWACYNRVTWGNIPINYMMRKKSSALDEKHKVLPSEYGTHTLTGTHHSKWQCLNSMWVSKIMHVTFKVSSYFLQPACNSFVHTVTNIQCSNFFPNTK